MRAAVMALGLLCALPAAAGAQAPVIVIDAGHGGGDPGGTGTGMQEKNIVLDVTERFRDLLNADSAETAAGGTWNVLLTRDNDTFVSLAARASYANSQGADRFMSIHSNAFGDPQANGTETFAYAEGGTGAALRNLVQEEMIRAWGLRNRGNKTANFAVLRETAMPAVLHELAFITNAVDAEKLASPAERQKAAEAHLYALQRHYNHEPHLPGQGDGGGGDGDGDGDEDPGGDGAGPSRGEGGGAERPDLDRSANLSGGCQAIAASGPTAGAGALLLLMAAGTLGRRRRRRS